MSMLSMLFNKQTNRSKQIATKSNQQNKQTKKETYQTKQNDTKSELIVSPVQRTPTTHI